MHKYFTFNTLIFICSFCFAQQPTPAARQVNTISLKNAKIHIGNGNVLINSQITFKDGKIIYVGANRTESQETEIINCEGKEVYPGFIAPNSTLGLTEIEAVRATNDFNEVGSNNASTRALIAYFTDSKVIPTVRTNGVLMAQVTPRGGLFSGQSSVVQLDAWNWEDAVIKADEGIHLNWPKMISSLYNDDTEQSSKEKNKSYDKSIQLITKYLQDAASYAKNNNIEKNLLLDAAKGLLDGSKILYVHANEPREITDAITICKKNNVSKIVIVGGSSSYLIAEFLKQNNVALMLQRPHSLPNRPDDDIDLPYKNAKILFDAGILFCLQNEGDMEAMNTRNLPFLAGTCVAYGLPYEQAVSAITSNTAKILGIESICGTIETGKDATLFVSDGDALDMKSNNVKLAFIRGRNIELTNIQSELNKKYKNKYELK